MVKCPESVSCVMAKVGPEKKPVTGLFYWHHVDKDIVYKLHTGSEGTEAGKGETLIVTPNPDAYPEATAVKLTEKDLSKDSPISKDTSVGGPKFSIISYGKPNSDVATELRLYYLAHPNHTDKHRYLRELVLHAHSDGHFRPRDWVDGDLTKEFKDMPIHEKSPVTAKVLDGQIKVFFRMKEPGNALYVAWNHARDKDGKVWSHRKVAIFDN